MEMMMRNPLLALALVGALATPAAASGTTTVPQFDADIAAARLTSSPGGTQILRSEMRAAVLRFINDDSTVDAAERAHLASRLADAAWGAGVTGSARKYAVDVAELNDGGSVAPLSVSDPQIPIGDQIGATGALTSSAWVQEGFIPNGEGVTNHITLKTAYRDAFDANPGNFEPINVRELIEALLRNTLSGTPSTDEVDGAVALISQISRNSNRLYVASWISDHRGGGPGDTGGFVVAAVSSDRRFVRFLEIRSWVE
jgi:hypothetical protein